MNQEDIERLMNYHSYLEEYERNVRGGSIFSDVDVEKHAKFDAYKTARERFENMFPEIDRLRKERNQEAGR